MNKRLAALCIALVLLLVLLPGAAAAGPALLSHAQPTALWMQTLVLVLAQQNMNKRLHPASITKVMTLGLACQQAQGQWEDVSLTVSHEDVYSSGWHRLQPHCVARVGQVPLTDALYATMMASANDGANLLAEYFGGGTIAGGVAEMNAQVEKTGPEEYPFCQPPRHQCRRPLYQLL